MITLYDLELSGNCYKVRLFLSLMRLAHKLRPIDFFAGEHKQPEHLARNPLGQLPVLEDGDVLLRDSGAILVYLARRYGADWLPETPEDMGRVMQWLATATSEMLNGPAAARVQCLLGEDGDLAGAQDLARRLLQTFDAHLSNREWLELGRPSIADVACYPYLALAPEGRISLEPYLHVRAWIGRVEALPGYVPMPGLPCGTGSAFLGDET